MFLGSTILPNELQMIDSADPWQMLMRLCDILGADSAPETMMSDILAALRNIPDIEACWYGPGDEHGWARHFGTLDIIGDWQADPRAATWPACAADLKIEAAAAVKLRGRGHGSLLVIYSATKNFFPEVWNAAFLAHLSVLIGNALESRETRAALQRAQHLYQTLFNGADILLSPKSESTVLKRLCKTIVDSGLFVSAGVGTVSASGMHRHVAAAARKNVRALRMARFQIVENQPRRPLAMDAWLADKTLIENNYFSNPRHEVMYGLARKLGFRSVAAMIIRRGGVRWAVMSVSAAETNYFDNELIYLLERMAGMVGHMLDELDLKAALRAEREIQSRIARQDALTRLPNRLAFDEQLAGAMARAVRQGAKAGIAMLDLDGFKQINDQWGHAAGDHVLCVAGGRMRAMLREVDFIARLGGDEFALILEGWVSPPERWAAVIEAFCNRLKEAVSAPVTLPNGEDVVISLSAGFTLFPSGDLAPDMLVRRADIALYAAKSAKGETGRFWRIYGEPEPGGEGQCRGAAAAALKALA